MPILYHSNVNKVMQHFRRFIEAEEVWWPNQNVGIIPKLRKYGRQAPTYSHIAGDPAEESDYDYAQYIIAMRKRGDDYSKYLYKVRRVTKKFIEDNTPRIHPAASNWIENIKSVPESNQLPADTNWLQLAQELMDMTMQHNNDPHLTQADLDNMVAHFAREIVQRTLRDGPKQDHPHLVLVKELDKAIERLNYGIQDFSEYVSHGQKDIKHSFG